MAIEFSFALFDTFALLENFFVCGCTGFNEFFCIFKWNELKCQRAKETCKGITRNLSQHNVRLCNAR